jgi:hypothetical protein
VVVGHILPSYQIEKERWVFFIFPVSVSTSFLHSVFVRVFCAAAN